MSSLLEYSEVSIAYYGKKTVHEVSFSIDAGECLCIVGESGSGKTTLIKAAMALLADNASMCHGSIYFKGQDMASLSPSELRKLSGSEISMIFQDSLSALTPTRTIRDQLLEMFKAHGLTHIDHAYAQALNLLEQLRIAHPHRVLESYPFELSGGMGQRVGIMFACILSPSLIIGDELTSALDVLSQKEVLKFFSEHKSKQSGLLLVTHNIALAKYIADSVVVLKDGRVQEYASSSEIFTHPKSEYTKSLLAASPKLRRE